VEADATRALEGKYVCTCCLCSGDARCSDAWGGALVGGSALQRRGDGGSINREQAYVEGSCGDEGGNGASSCEGAVAGGGRNGVLRTRSGAYQVDSRVLGVGRGFIESGRQLLD